MEINVHYYHNVHLITFITCTSKFNWQKKKDAIERTTTKKEN